MEKTSEMCGELQLAIFHLRRHFKPVSKFIADPLHCIGEAKRQFNKGALSRIFSSLDRYRAEESLKLNIEACRDVQQKIDKLEKDIASVGAVFESVDDNDVAALYTVVKNTGLKTQACTAYVTNCLDVISGRESKLRYPNGPDFRNL